MTTDEELNQLEDGLRRLKIDYDIYFNGGAKRPPSDSQWRVETMVKRLADSSTLNSTQRYRYNSLAQRYSLFSELWRQRLKVREEGPRRTVVGVRAEGHKKPEPFRIGWSDPAAEPEKVDRLFDAFMKAKEGCGEKAGSLGPEAFRRFVQQKTEQLKRELHCESVEYVVEVEAGQVKLLAKGR